jgi:hypothetical protein
MESIRDDTIGGFNAFLQKQKDEPGEATLTLVQFDTQDPYEVIHRFKPIQEVTQLTRDTFVPRAATPLLDAIGRGINDLESSLNGLAADDRPVKVIFTIVTDGQENSSREFRKDQIEIMIKDRKEKDGWQFIFLSTELEAINDAIAMGIPAQAAMVFERSSKGTDRAWNALSDGISDVRSGRKKDAGL